MAIYNYDTESMTNVSNSLKEATEDAVKYFRMLRNFMDEVTKGGIEGEIAIEIYEKFEQKEDVMRDLETYLIEAADYMGIQTDRFKSVVADISSGLR